MFAAVAAAVAASICCLAPLLAVTVGAGGAWATGVPALAPYRPTLTGLAFVGVGLVVRHAYRPRSADGPCARHGIRASLWILGPLVLAILAVPHVKPYLASAEPNVPARVTAPSGNHACCAMRAQQGVE